jgi:hypothetical protein
LVEYQILYWHDIPVQVRAREGRKRLNKPLSERFQVAIDHAAMAAGLIGDDEYTEKYQWSKPVEAQGSLEGVVDNVAADLEEKHKVIDWQSTVKHLEDQKRSWITREE